MNSRTLAKITGFSYLVIFFAAIFANFMVIEAIRTTPVETIVDNHMTVRLGIIAFLITVVFDVIVAWSLYELYKKHTLSLLSTFLRMMHAAIMGVAIFTLPLMLSMKNAEDILNQIELFNIIWLIGLFFLGMHLICLGRIFNRPKLIATFLTLAGIMYMVDTSAYIVLPDYAEYASSFLLLVAIPSIAGEMAFAIWMLVKGGKTNS